MEQKNLNRHTFNIDNKKIAIYPCADANRPIIYLNTVEEEESRLYHMLCSACCSDFTLVTISGLNWEHDMSPWDIPPISKGAAPCTGGADAYLQLLIDEIVPKTEKCIQAVPAWRGLAGYSLAGLFTIYSLYQTTLFSRAAAMSASLWFPNFKEYLFSHEIMRTPDYLYFSLGNKECRTRNPYLRTVQDNTEEIEAFFRQKGVNTIFEIHPGNHFDNAVERTAAGILWLLNR